MTRLRPELFCLRMVSYLRSVAGTEGSSSTASRSNVIGIDNISDLLPLMPRTYRDRRTILRQLSSFVAFGGWAKDHISESEVETKGHRMFALEPKHTSLRKSKTKKNSSQGGAHFDRSAPDLLHDCLSAAGSNGMTGKEIQAACGISAKRVYNLCNMLSVRMNVVNQMEIKDGARANNRRYFINEAAMRCSAGSDGISTIANVTMRIRANHIINEVRRSSAVALTDLIKRVTALEKKTKTITRKNFIKLVNQLKDDGIVFHEGDGKDVKAVVAVIGCDARIVEEAAQPPVKPKQEKVQKASRVKAAKNVPKLKVPKQKDPKQKNPKQKVPKQKVPKQKVPKPAKARTPETIAVRESTSQFVNELYTAVEEKPWRKQLILLGDGEDTTEMLRTIFKVIVFYRTQNFDETLESYAGSTFIQAVVVGISRAWIIVSGQLSHFRSESSPSKFLRNVLNISENPFWGHFNITMSVLANAFCDDKRDLVRAAFCLKGGAIQISCGSEDCQFDDEMIQRRRCTGYVEKEADVTGVARVTRVDAPRTVVDVEGLTTEGDCIWINNGNIHTKLLKLCVRKVAMYVIDYPGITVDIIMNHWRTWVSIDEIQAILRFLQREGLVECMNGKLWFPVLEKLEKWRSVYEYVTDEFVHKL